MLHSESALLVRAHEPVRNSTLRQVASTYDDPKAEIANSASLLQQPPSAPPSLVDETIGEKIVTLGIHDGSTTNSNALLHPSLFPEAAIGRGRLVKISPVTDDDPVNDRPYDRASKASKKNIVGDEHANGTKGGRLFIAEPMASDVAAKPSGAKVRSAPCVPSTTFICFRSQSLPTRPQDVDSDRKAKYRYR